MIESDGIQLHDVHVFRMTEPRISIIAVAACRLVVIVMPVSMRVVMNGVKIDAVTVAAMHQYIAMTAIHMRMQRTERRQC